LKPTEAGIYCPECRARVIQKGMDGKIKLRTKLISFDTATGETKAVCKWCGAKVSVDIRAGESLVKAMGSPRLVIKPVESS
jgi:DNA-directed RNA polymerase subunit RPC12/RpoP